MADFAYLNQDPFVRQVTVDKIRGAVVGSALGDAIGLYTGRSTIDKADKFTEGSWTDDTDHALLIILSFLHSNGKKLSPQDFAARLKIWIEQGLLCLGRLPLGIGRLVGTVVLKKGYLHDPEAAAYQNWALSNFKSAPNGSLMRTYPLGIMCLERSPEDTFAIAANFSRVTHFDQRCVVSCCIATALIRGILLGEVTEEKHIDTLIDSVVLFLEHDTGYQSVASKSNDLGYFPPPFDRAELDRHVQATAYGALELDDALKIGYVYKCLGSSILCLRLAMRRLQSTDTIEKNVRSSRHVFEEVITELIMEGGDADTNGAVAGAFVGCYVGFAMLPPHWYEGLHDIDWLLQKSNALMHVLGINKCADSYVGSEDPDTDEDGGKGFLDREQLEAREKAFMEVYLRKTMEKKNLEASPNKSGVSGLVKKWKGIFG